MDASLAIMAAGDPYEAAEAFGSQDSMSYYALAAARALAAKILVDQEDLDAVPVRRRAAVALTLFSLANDLIRGTPAQRTRAFAAAESLLSVSCEDLALDPSRFEPLEAGLPTELALSAILSGNLDYFPKTGSPVPQLARIGDAESEISLRSISAEVPLWRAEAEAAEKIRQGDVSGLVDQMIIERVIRGGGGGGGGATVDELLSEAEELTAQGQRLERQLTDAYRTTQELKDQRNSVQNRYDEAVRRSAAARREREAAVDTPQLPTINIDAVSEAVKTLLATTAAFDSYAGIPEDRKALVNRAIEYLRTHFASTDGYLNTARGDFNYQPVVKSIFDAVREAPSAAYDALRRRWSILGDRDRDAGIISGYLVTAHRLINDKARKLAQLRGEGTLTGVDFPEGAGPEDLAAAKRALEGKYESNRQLRLQADRVRERIMEIVMELNRLLDAVEGGGVHRSRRSARLAQLRTYKRLGLDLEPRAAVAATAEDEIADLVRVAEARALLRAVSGAAAPLAAAEEPEIMLAPREEIGVEERSLEESERERIQATIGELEDIRRRLDTASSVLPEAAPEAAPKPAAAAAPEAPAAAAAAPAAAPSMMERAVAQLRSWAASLTSRASPEERAEAAAATAARDDAAAADAAAAGEAIAATDSLAAGLETGAATEVDAARRADLATITLTEAAGAPAPTGNEERDRLFSILQRYLPARTALMPVRMEAMKVMRARGGEAGTTDAQKDLLQRTNALLGAQVFLDPELISTTRDLRTIICRLQGAPCPTDDTTMDLDTVVKALSTSYGRLRWARIMLETQDWAQQILEQVDLMAEHGLPLDRLVRVRPHVTEALDFGDGSVPEVVRLVAPSVLHEIVRGMILGAPVLALHPAVAALLGHVAKSEAPAGGYDKPNVEMVVTQLNDFFFADKRLPRDVKAEFEQLVMREQSWKELAGTMVRSDAQNARAAFFDLARFYAADTDSVLTVPVLLELEPLRMRRVYGALVTGESADASDLSDSDREAVNNALLNMLPNMTFLTESLPSHAKALTLVAAVVPYLSTDSEGTDDVTKSAVVSYLIGKASTAPRRGETKAEEVERADAALREAREQRAIVTGNEGNVSYGAILNAQFSFRAQIQIALANGKDMSSLELANVSGWNASTRVQREVTEDYYVARLREIQGFFGTCAKMAADDVFCSRVMSQPRFFEVAHEDRSLRTLFAACEARVPDMRFEGGLTDANVATARTAVTDAINAAARRAIERLLTSIPSSEVRSAVTAKANRDLPAGSTTSGAATYEVADLTGSLTLFTFDGSPYQRARNLLTPRFVGAGFTHAIHVRALLGHGLLAAFSSGLSTPTVWHAAVGMQPAKEAERTWAEAAYDWYQWFDSLGLRDPTDRSPRRETRGTEDDVTLVSGLITERVRVLSKVYAARYVGDTTTAEATRVTLAWLRTLEDEHAKLSAALRELTLFNDNPLQMLWEAPMQVRDKTDAAAIAVTINDEKQLLMVRRSSALGQLLAGPRKGDFTAVLKAHPVVIRFLARACLGDMDALWRQALNPLLDAQRVKSANRCLQAAFEARLGNDEAYQAFEWIDPQSFRDTEARKAFWKTLGRVALVGLGLAVAGTAAYVLFAAPSTAAAAAAEQGASSAFNIAYEVAPDSAEYLERLAELRSPDVEIVDLDALEEPIEAVRSAIETFSSTTAASNATVAPLFDAVANFTSAAFSLPVANVTSALPVA